MCTLSVSNVIYHKFSHGAAFYMLNGKNVNVMLELTLYDGPTPYVIRRFSLRRVSNICEQLVPILVLV